MGFEASLDLPAFVAWGPDEEPIFGRITRGGARARGGSLDVGPAMPWRNNTVRVQRITGGGLEQPDLPLETLEGSGLGETWSGI